MSLEDDKKGDLGSKARGFLSGLKSTMSKIQHNNNSPPHAQSTHAATHSTLPTVPMPGVDTPGDSMPLDSSVSSSPMAQSAGRLSPTQPEEEGETTTKTDEVMAGIQHFIHEGGEDVLQQKQTLALLTKTARHVNAKYRELQRHKRSGDALALTSTADEECLAEITAFFAKLPTIRFKKDPTATEEGVPEASEINLELFPHTTCLQLTGLHVIHVKAGESIQKLVLNESSSLQENLAVFPKVTEVDIEGCDLERILPSVAGDVTALRVAGVVGWSLQTTLQNHENLLMITVLDAVNVGWEEIPPAVSALVELTHLNVSGNRITQLQHLGACKKLLSLNISLNRISSLKCLMGVGEESDVSVALLEDLDASNNPITEVKGIGPWLTSIRSLNLADCKLADWNQLNHLVRIPTLKAFSLSGNPIYTQPGLPATARCLVIDLILQESESIDDVLEKSVDGAAILPDEVMQQSGTREHLSLSPSGGPADAPSSPTKFRTLMASLNNEDEVAHASWPSAREERAPDCLVLELDSPRSPIREVGGEDGASSLHINKAAGGKKKKQVRVVRKNVPKHKPVDVAADVPHSPHSPPASPASPSKSKRTQTSPELSPRDAPSSSSFSSPSTTPRKVKSTPALAPYADFVKDIALRVKARLELNASAYGFALSQWSGHRKDASVNDTFKGWSDGVILSALLHGCSNAFLPDFHNLNPNKGEENVGKVVTSAERTLLVQRPVGGAEALLSCPLVTATWVSRVLLAVQDYENQRTESARLLQIRLVEEIELYRKQRHSDRARLQQAPSRNNGGALEGSFDSIGIDDTESSGDEATSTHVGSIG